MPSPPSSPVPVVRRRPDRALGRLLDRAAGALSTSHPALAAELTARAGPEHEPDDPFDGLTGDDDVDRFRTFGYLVLPDFLGAGLVRALRAEVVEALTAVHGEPAARSPARSPGAGGAPAGAGGDGRAGPRLRSACLLGPWAPRSVEVVDDARLVGLAERLVGGPVLPSPCDTEATVFLDHVGWHNDTGIAVRAVKVVAYLEPLAAGTGALRVLPGSHRLTDDALAHLHTVGLSGPDVPGPVLATEPGDVIVFDPLLYHATWTDPAAGPPAGRHQWSTTYLRDAVAPSWRPGLVEWFAEGASWVDDLPEGRRPFDPAWVAAGSGDVGDPRLERRHRWMYRFHRLGVLDAFGVADAFRP